MKRFISIAVCMVLAVTAMAKWNVVHNEADNKIIAFFEAPDNSNTETKYTLYTYTNECEAAAKAEILIASGAKVVDNVIVSTNWTQRYVYENTFLLLCDQLSGQTNHAKLPMESLTLILLQVRQQDKNRYEIVRDALNMINSSLTRIDTKWWDVVQYRDIPSVVAGATQLMGLIQ